MKILSGFFILILASVNLSAQKFGLQWVDQLVSNSSTNNIQNVQLAIDNADNVYAAFTFIGTVDFDPSPSTVTATASGRDIFIAKYTKDGVLTADRFQLANAGDQTVTDIAIDTQGNIYITGYANGLVNYSPSGVTANIANAGTTGTDIFLAKYTETGQFVWVKTYGSPTDAEGLALAVDGNNNIFLAGKFRGTMSVFAGGVTSSLISQGSLSDIFFARFQSSGTLDWAYRIGEDGEDVAEDIFYHALTQSIIITGAFQGVVDFDPGNGVRNLSSTIFADNSYLAKYSTAGIIDWAIAFAGGNSVGSDIVVDSNSDVYVTGYFQTASPGADFDPSPAGNALVAAKGVPDSYVAKYSANGNYLWAKSMGAGFGVGGHLSVTPSNQLIASGVFAGDIDFGTSQVVDNLPGSTGTYIARFEEDGTFLSHATIAESNNFEQTMKEGNLFIGGRPRGTGEFDPINSDDELTSSSTYDTYFAKYDATPPKLKANNTQAATLGTDLLVSIELEDPETGVAPNGAFIQYRDLSSADDDSFDTVELINTTGNIFEGTIPSTQFGKLGIEFRGVAANTVGVVGPTSLQTKNFIVPGDGLAIPQRGSGNGAQSDYRIISIPLTLSSATVKSIFEDDLGPYDPNAYRLFGFTAGDPGKTTELNATSNLEVGRGYWFIAAGKKEINTGAGSTVQVGKSNPFTLTLDQGWNLIGNPYNFNISWADMKAANGALIEDLRVFNNIGWGNGTQIDAMSGGFVFANDTKTIGFPVVKNTAINSGRIKEAENVNPREPLLPGDWEINLNLQQANVSYNLGGLGMRSDANVDYDKYDEMSLPRFANYLEINHAKNLHGYNYSMDVVPTALEKIWEFTIESAQAGQTTINWEPASLSTLHNQLFLVDLERQWPIDMTANSSYVFETNGVHRFKVVYGNPDFVKKEITGDQFVFYGVHPNPAVNQTAITFSVPDEAKSGSSLSVKLFSTLGQKVASYTYNVDGSGIKEEPLPLSGLSVSPGIYIVQVQFGSIQKQTRLLIK